MGMLLVYPLGDFTGKDNLYKGRQQEDLAVPFAFVLDPLSVPILRVLQDLATNCSEARRLLNYTRGPCAVPQDILVLQESLTECKSGPYRGLERTPDPSKARTYAQFFLQYQVFSPVSLKPCTSLNLEGTPFRISRAWRLSKGMNQILPKYAQSRLRQTESQSSSTWIPEAESSAMKRKKSILRVAGSSEDVPIYNGRVLIWKMRTTVGI
ncbi:hypothetical protein EJ08DRAFT_655281 [Tothia fuscella]|uniref:Uncharacterized protein n=1 Tax=Tothia fuscella TaxID=1048955 RepID=A0A9P4P5V7_9PEZI|nr:hypothetical protein EJ08DRAFT_655281 [Tothia fuscella]